MGVFKRCLVGLKSDKDEMGEYLLNVVKSISILV
jgi:hypothetical protein